MKFSGRLIEFHHLEKYSSFQSRISSCVTKVAETSFGSERIPRAESACERTSGANEPREIALPASTRPSEHKEEKRPFRPQLHSTQRFPQSSLFARQTGFRPR